MTKRLLCPLVSVRQKWVQDSVLKASNPNKYAKKYGGLGYCALHGHIFMPQHIMPKIPCADYYELGGSSLFDSQFAERKQEINY